MSAWILRLLGMLMVASALAVALSRAPDRPVQTLVARWAPPPSNFIDVKGQIVHLRDEGPREDALPIVLLHGTSASLHTWQGWVRELKTQRRVITLDLPGFGLTGPFTGTYAALGERTRYHGDHYARFVLDVLDTLHVRRVVLGGNSLGGEIAWRTAHLAPQRVASLVLVAPAGTDTPPQLVPLGFRIARTPVVNRVAEWLLPRAAVAQSLAEVYGDPARVSPELVERYFELTLREGNRRALAMRLTHAVPGEHAERIAGLTQPTLLLWGGRDRLIPPAAAKRFGQMAASQLVLFDDLGHVPQEEDPARTVVPVKAFLGLR
jgi:pimeloyl-ACP methyl ester carboxylesterase